MIKQPWNIPSFLYDRDIDIESRLGIFFIDIGIITAVLGTLLSIFCHAPWQGVLACGAIAICAPVIMAIFFMAGHPEKSGLAIGILLPVAISFVYVTNGGLNSGVAFWFIFTLYFMSLFSQGVTFIVLMVYGLIAFVICFCINFFCPSLIASLPSALDISVSRIGCLAIVGASIIATTIVQKNMYKREKTISDQKQQTTVELVMAIANIVDARDRYTSSHSRRVAVISRDIAREMGFSQKAVDDIYYAGLLHDIGKIGVSDALLNKPTRLNEVEYEIMQQHTLTGADLLKGLGFLDYAYDVARSHHERFDGTGYPDGLAGEDIPLHARIVAVADAYDAMSMDRVYRRRLSTERILEELTVCQNTQFDPKVAKTFLSMLRSGYVADENLGDNKAEPLVLSPQTQRTLKALINSSELLARDDGDVHFTLSTPSITPLVKNDQFRQLYRYLQDLGGRQNFKTTLVKIDLTAAPDSQITEESLKRAMGGMATAISQFLRKADICTQYGASSYLLILLNAGGGDNVGIIINRVFQSFYSLCDESGIIPQHQILKPDDFEGETEQA